MKLERAYSEIADIMPEERVLLNEKMSNHTTFCTGRSGGYHGKTGHQIAV